MRLPKNGGSKYFAAFTGINSPLLYNEIQTSIMVTQYIVKNIISLYIRGPTNSLFQVSLSFIECVDVYSLLLKSPSGERKHTSALRNVDLWTILVFIFLVNLGGKLISYKPAIDLRGLQDILLYFKIIWYCKRFFRLLFFFTVVIHFPVSIFFPSLVRVREAIRK